MFSLFSEILNENEKAAPIELLVSAQTEWFSKLIAFVWSHFDSNVDVILFFYSFFLLNMLVSFTIDYRIQR